MLHLANVIEKYIEIGKNAGIGEDQSKKLFARMLKSPMSELHSLERADIIGSTQAIERNE
jgi:hypothetical protein